MPLHREPFASYQALHDFFRAHARYPRQVYRPDPPRGRYDVRWEERTDLPRIVKLDCNTVLRQLLWDPFAASSRGQRIETEAGWALEPPDYEIELHGTPILRFHGGGLEHDAARRDLVTLRTAGWLTQTTRDRINTYLPLTCVHLWQQHGLVTMHQPQRDLGAFIEGFEVYLDGRLPAHSERAVADQAAAMASNAQYERGINRLVRKALGHKSQMLVWEQDIESNGALWCDDCVRSTWSREHLIRHVESGKLTVELLDRACFMVLHAGYFNWRGSGQGGDSPAARLRAYLRDCVLVGPYVTKTGRRLPNGGDDRPTTGFNHHAHTA